MSEHKGHLQSGAEILVQCLINHGVDVIFAYPGGASMPFTKLLPESRISFVPFFLGTNKVAHLLLKAMLEPLAKLAFVCPPADQAQLILSPPSQMPKWIPAPSCALLAK